MVKKILSIVLWAVTAIALVVLFAFGRRHYLETPLQGIAFHIDRHLEKGFIDRDSEMRQFESVCDLEHHTKISGIDLMKIQKLLSGNPWVETSSAYIGLNDTLTITVKEYEPVLRVFTQDKRSVYVTHEGIIFPSSPRYTPRTIIASGHYNFPAPLKGDRATDSLYKDSGIKEALAIAEALQQDPFLNGNVGQIYRNEKNEYELTVNNLQARVLLGDTLQMASKLSNLKVLLEKYSGTDELSGYKTVDLQYKNQIVCTKQ